MLGSLGHAPAVGGARRQRAAVGWSLTGAHAPPGARPNNPKARPEGSRRVERQGEAKAPAHHKMAERGPSGLWSQLGPHLKSGTPKKMSPTQLGPTEPAGAGAAAAAVYALEGGFPRTRLLAEGPPGTGDCRCGRPPLGTAWPSRCVPG